MMTHRTHICDVISELMTSFQRNKSLRYRLRARPRRVQLRAHRHDQVYGVVSKRQDSGIARQGLEQSAAKLHSESSVTRGKFF